MIKYSIKILIGLTPFVFALPSLSYVARACPVFQVASFPSFASVTCAYSAFQAARHHTKHAISIGRHFAGIEPMSAEARQLWNENIITPTVSVLDLLDDASEVGIGVGNKLGLPTGRLKNFSDLKRKAKRRLLATFGDEHAYPPTESRLEDGYVVVERVYKSEYLDSEGSDWTVVQSHLDELD